MKRIWLIPNVKTPKEIIMSCTILCNDKRWMREEEAAAYSKIF